MAQPTSLDDVELLDALGTVDDVMANSPDILNSLDLNCDDNQQLAQCGPVLNRGSKRRSSILKLTEPNEIRRSRRVSWAKTYECRKLLSDGTTTEVISQQLNKFGPDLPPKSDIENQPPGEDEKMKRRRSGEHFTKVFSKYYNLDGDSKDIETICNTASNLYGLEAEEMKRLYNVFYTNNPDKNFADFLKTLHQVPAVAKPQDPFLPSDSQPGSQEVVGQKGNNPNFTLIADITLDAKAFQNVCNSTNVAHSDQMSVHEFWKNQNGDSSIASLGEVNNTLHETTFMKMSDEEENGKKSSDIPPPEVTKELSLSFGDSNNDDKPKASGFLANMQAVEDNLEPDLSINLSDDDKLKMSDDKGHEKQNRFVENTTQLMALSETEHISTLLPVTQSNIKPNEDKKHEEPHRNIENTTELMSLSITELVSSEPAAQPNDFLARLQQEGIGETKSLDLESKSTIYPAETKSFSIFMDPTQQSMVIDHSREVSKEVERGVESQKENEILKPALADRTGNASETILGFESREPEKTMVRVMREAIQLQQNEALYADSIITDTSNASKSIIKPNTANSFSIFMDPTHQSMMINQSKEKSNQSIGEAKVVSESQKENEILACAVADNDENALDHQKVEEHLSPEASQEVLKVKSKFLGSDSLIEKDIQDTEMSLDLSMDQTLCKEESLKKETKESTCNLSFDLSMDQTICKEESLKKEGKESTCNLSFDLSMDQTICKEESLKKEGKELTCNLSLDISSTQKHTSRLDSPMVTLHSTSLTQLGKNHAPGRFLSKLLEQPSFCNDPPTSESIDLDIDHTLQKTLDQLQNITENMEFSMAQMEDSTTADIKVDVIEITNNRLDTCSQEEYVPTKPLHLGKSASAILEEEDLMETEDFPEPVTNDDDKCPEQAINEDSVEEKSAQVETETPVQEISPNESSAQEEALAESEVFAEPIPLRPLDRFQPNLSVLMEEIEPSFYSSKRTSLLTGLVDRTRKDTISVATLNSELNTIGQKLSGMSSSTFSFNRLSQFGTSYSSASKTTRLGLRAAATKPVAPPPPPPPAPKQIELDFNTSGPDRSMPEEEIEEEIEQTKPNQFIRKSLGLNLREKLIQRQQEMQKESPSPVKAVDLEVQKHQETMEKIRELEVEIATDRTLAFDRTETRTPMLTTFDKSSKMNLLTSMNKTSDLYNLSILNASSRRESKVTKTNQLDIDLTQTNQNKLEDSKSAISRLDFELSIAPEQFEPSMLRLSKTNLSIKNFDESEGNFDLSKTHQSKLQISQGALSQLDLSLDINEKSKQEQSHISEKIETMQSQLSYLSQLNITNAKKSCVMPIDTFSMHEQSQDVNKSKSMSMSTVTGPKATECPPTELEMDNCELSKAHLSRFEMSKPDLSELNLSEALSKGSIHIAQSSVTESKNSPSPKRGVENETLLTTTKKLKTSIVDASMSNVEEASFRPSIGFSLEELKQPTSEVSSVSSPLPTFEYSALERSALRLLELNETQPEVEDDSIESTFVAESVLSPIKLENDGTIDYTELSLDLGCLVDLERTIYKPSSNMTMHDLEQTLLDMTIPLHFESHDAVDLSKLIQQIRENKKLKLRIQALDDNAIYIRFLFSTLELRIHFGARLSRPSCVKEEDVEVHREIVRLDLVNLLQSNETMEAQYPRMAGCEEDAMPLYDGDWMKLRFKDEHRQYLYLAHDIVHNNNSNDKRFKEKFRDTGKLFELIQEFYLEVVSPARKLATELRRLHSKQMLKILDRDSEGRFRIMVDILGLRSTISIIFAFDHLTYPDEVIHPEVIVAEEDKHLYPLDQFPNAFRKIPPHKFGYISKLLRGGWLFVAAIRKVMCQEKRQQLQKQAIREAKFVPTPPQNQVPTH